MLALAGAGFCAQTTSTTTFSATADASQGLLSQSAMRLAAGDFSAALDLARQAEAAQPVNARAYLEAGVAELKLGRYAEATADAARAIELGDRRAAAYNVRSAALTDSGRFADGLADAEKAVAANPGGAIGYINRAAAKAGLGRPGAEILVDFRRAAELDPKYEGRYEAAQRLWPEAARQAAASATAPTPPAKTIAAPAPDAKADAAPRQAPSEPVAPVSPPAAQDWRRIWALFSAVVILALLAWPVVHRRKTHRLRQVRFGAVPVAAAESDRLAQGSVLAGLYVTGRFLERRGNVEIYEARDLEDRPRLLKRLALRGPLADAARARARKAGALRHPAVESVETIFERDGWLCVCCSPMAGETLAAVKAGLGRLRWAPEQALGPLQGACEALDEAHRRGLVHGALGPSSIWIERGKGALADFAVGPALLGEAAPEAGPEEDVHALARAFVELLGEPAEAKAVFARALAADHAGWFRSAGELFQAFRSAVVPVVQ